MLGMRRALEGVLRRSAARPASPASTATTCRASCPARPRRWIGGDARDRSIMAASILAKVARDRFMRELHDDLPAVRLRPAQGLFDARAPRRAAQPRPLPAAPAQLRAGAGLRTGLADPGNGLNPARSAAMPTPRGDRHPVKPCSCARRPNLPALVSLSMPSMAQPDRLRIVRPGHPWRGRSRTAADALAGIC